MTPPPGTRGPALVASTIPHSPFGLVARVSATHKRDQTVAGPPQSPTRSVEGSGSQTDPQPPWYNGRAGIIPFQYSPDLLGGRERARESERATERERERARARAGCRLPLNPSSPQSKQELNFNNETYGVGVWRVVSYGARGVPIAARRISSRTAHITGGLQRLIGALIPAA